MDEYPDPLAVSAAMARAICTLHPITTASGDLADALKQSIAQARRERDELRADLEDERRTIAMYGQTIVDLRAAQRRDAELIEHRNMTIESKNREIVKLTNQLAEQRAMRAAEDLADNLSRT